MAWQNPKTDWTINPKNPVPEDFNRIEGNIDFLKQDIETKKGIIVDAINDMNQPAQVTDTHAQLASKIRDISNDATAAVGDVEKGKTFYSGGQKRTGTLTLSGTAGTGDVLSGKTFYNTDLKTKRTGTMANHGAKVYTPGTANITIPKGYHNGSGYVKGDANLIPENIVVNKSIFGVKGNKAPLYRATGNVTTIKPSDDWPYLLVNNLNFRPKAVMVNYLEGQDRPSRCIIALFASMTSVLYSAWDIGALRPEYIGRYDLYDTFVTENGFQIRLSISDRWNRSGIKFEYEAIG